MQFALTLDAKDTLSNSIYFYGASENNPRVFTPNPCTHNLLENLPNDHPKIPFQKACNETTTTLNLLYTMVAFNFSFEVLRW